MDFYLLSWTVIEHHRIISIWSCPLFFPKPKKADWLMCFRLNIYESLLTCLQNMMGLDGFIGVTMVVCPVAKRPADFNLDSHANVSKATCAKLGLHLWYLLRAVSWPCFLWSQCSSSYETSGVARAFPGGRVAHPEGQNEEENKVKFEGK